MNCQQTKELQILGNRIENAMEAIVCAGSEWQRAIIARNSIVMISGSNDLPYHAIWTGTVRSQVIERNRILGVQRQGTAVGITTLPASEFMMIRENHMESVSVGIRFELPVVASGTGVPPGVQWMIVDNLTRGGSNVLPTSTVGLKVENNIVS